MWCKPSSGKELRHRSLWSNKKFLAGVQLL